MNPLRLNLGGGNIKLPGFTNVDKYNPNADIKADIRKLPFENGSVEEVLLNHVIEHIPYRDHIKLLEEIHRVLKEDGVLSIGFPEFEKCVEAFLSNHGGDRWKWWVQTLYGSQTDEGQFHVAPITREHLTEQLFQVGFHKVDYKLDEFNAFLKCKKTKPLPWF